MKAKNQFFKIMFLNFSLFLLFGCNIFDESEEATPPQITLTADETSTTVGSTVKIRPKVTADTSFTITWSVSAGIISESSDTLLAWEAPADTLQAKVTATVQTSDNQTATANVTLSVGNNLPSITTFTGSAEYILFGNQISLTCQATDPEGFALTYNYYTVPDSGMITQLTPQSETAIWQAPDAGNISGQPFLIIVEVTDSQGLSANDTIDVLAYLEYESIWVVDSGLQAVAKYTANGTKVFTASGSFLKPVAVTNDVEDFYGCYVADYDAGTVVKVGAFGQTLNTYNSIPQVIDIAMHQDTRTIWALGVGDGSLTIIDAFSEQIIKKIFGLSQPRWIHINQASGDIWISEQGNNRLIQLNTEMLNTTLPDTITTQNATVFPDSGVTNYLNSPFIPYSPNQIGASTYLADRNDFEIERFDWDGNNYIRNNLPFSLGSESPRAVKQLSVSGLGETLLAITFDGNIFGFPVNNPTSPQTISGGYIFKVPHAIVANPAVGECWIGDNGNHQLVKISINSDYTYNLQKTLNGFIFIEDIVINK